MPAVRSQVGRSTASPLSQEDLERASRLAARLQAELGAVIGTFPEAARGASGMSRHLGVVRPTCQRIVRAVADADPQPGVLVRLPGVQGLEQFLDAAGACAPKRPVENARAAVAEFARFLASAGGSQSRLGARLAATEAAAVDPESRREAERAALFEAASGIMGRSVETSLSIHIFRPLGAAEDQLERWLAGGVSGARFRPGGMPLVVTTGKDQSTETRAEGEAPGWNPSSPELLASFTSDPLPTMTARGSTGKQVQVIDPGSCAPGSAIDMVFAERLVSPMVEPSGEPALQEVWSLVNSPSRHLVFDVYLHERLERRFRPAVDAQLWYPNLASPGDNRWLTRLPGQPRLELLGRGLGRAATGASPRHGELTEHLFARAGLEASAYLGFRCEVAFPVWRAGYRFAFEHTPD